VSGAAFPREVVAAFPHAVRTAPADDGVALAGPPKCRGGLTERWTGHVFDGASRGRGIERGPAKPCHPRTDGRAERTNRPVEEGTVEAFRHPDPDASKARVVAFARARDFAERLEALRRRSPLQATCDARRADPAPFEINPRHLTPGPCA
jgi:hypothetical protein